MNADLRLTNANVLDVFTKKFVQKDVYLKGDKVFYVGQTTNIDAEKEIDLKGGYLVPGFIDAHMHIESSLVQPTVFGQVALKHGVTRVFADPHEIANVAGVQGIQYMIDASKKTPLNIHYMLPSSVPATPFENNGATLKAKDLKGFYSYNEVAGLGEVMDFPAVANEDSDMLEKIQDALANNRHVDGHAAGLNREQLALYRNVGISTDHESDSQEMALDRVNAGFKVFVREGTVERDEENILPLINDTNEASFAFCTDDKTIADIENEGTIDYNVRLAIKKGLKAEIALKMASYNAAVAHKMENVGAIADGYVADLLVLDRIDEEFTIQSEFVAGQMYDLNDSQAEMFNMEITPLKFDLSEDDLKLEINSDKAHIIEVEPHHITTTHQIQTMKKTADNLFVATEKQNKIVVVERYNNLGYGLGIISGLNIFDGAIASTVSHDSHNLVATGSNDLAIMTAINRLKELGGGQIVVNGQGDILAEMPLSIAGLMSNKPYLAAIDDLEKLQKAYQTISNGIDFDPFLTLSFMSLPVIPSLKITNKGLWDFEQMKFIAIEA